MSYLLDALRKADAERARGSLPTLQAQPSPTPAPDAGTRARFHLGWGLLIGVLLQGGYNGVWPLAAGSYPSAVRATGIGWAIGIGRSGAIVGPWIGGQLMAAKVSLPVLFGTYCIPLLACAACVFTVQRVSANRIDRN